MLDIVHVSVSQTQAPIPNNLQKRGLIISVGGTTESVGTIFTSYGSDDLLPKLSSDSDSSEQISGRVAKYFENNTSGNPVFILEIGKIIAADGVAYLKTWLEENVNQYYIINLPTAYDIETTLVDLVKLYENTTDKQYFSFGVSKTSYSPYKGIKSCICCVSNNDKEYVDIAPMAILNSYDPGLIQKATPLAFRYVFGYSPYLANNPSLGQLKSDFVNYVDTGAEGGISNNLIKWGTTMDGRDALYWYAVDWVAINAKLNLANEVINGSNNPQNPLFYNQRGIDRLEARLDNLMTDAVSFGISLQGFSIDSIKFKEYVMANPSDFRIGKYAGLGITFTPNRGFTQIYIAIDVTDFA